jgi:hypothetical protein
MLRWIVWANIWLNAVLLGAGAMWLWSNVKRNREEIIELRRSHAATAQFVREAVSGSLGCLPTLRKGGLGRPEEIVE